MSRRGGITERGLLRRSEVLSARPVAEFLREESARRPLEGTRVPGRAPKSAPTEVALVFASKTLPYLYRFLFLP